MKKLISLSLLATFAFGLLGCAKEEPADTGPVASPTKDNPGPMDSGSGAGGAGKSDNAPATANTSP